MNNETAMFVHRGQVVIRHRDVVRQWTMTPAEARTLATALALLADEAESQERQARAAMN